MKNRNALLSIARIWGFISMLFLCFMLMAHLFGEESMSFTNGKELFTFIFFPLGIIFGLFVSYRSSITGGIICIISILISVWMIPELMKNFYYVFCVTPGILFLVVGVKNWKLDSK